eukprot:2017692-Amphidinium_carterae.1
MFSFTILRAVPSCRSLARRLSTQADPGQRYCLGLHCTSVAPARSDAGGASAAHQPLAVIIPALEVLPRASDGDGAWMSLAKGLAQRSSASVWAVAWTRPSEVNKRPKSFVAAQRMRQACVRAVAD